MARLQITSPGFEGRVFDLNLGVNRIGRHSDNDFQIEDPTVSGAHCEIVLGGEELVIRDCGSTNGTYIDGKRISEEILKAGQVLRLGAVDCLVEDVEIRVSVPTLEVSGPAPPKILEDGSLCCFKHETTSATYRCTKCKTVMCVNCIHRIQRRGGQALLLCPLCGNAVEQIRPKPQSKRSWADFLKTVKVPFAEGRRRKK